MLLDDLAIRIGAKVVTDGPARVEIQQVYAGDRISDLLNGAHDRALLVSNLTGPQLLQVAGLMDVPAVCLVNGCQPDRQTVDAATRQKTALLVSPVGMFETCGRLYQSLLAGEPKLKGPGRQ